MKTLDVATPGKQAEAMLHRLHLPHRPVSDFVENMWLVHGHVPVPQRHMLLPDGGLVLIFNLGEPQKLCERADVRRHAVFRASWVSGQQPQPIVIEQKGQYHLLGVRFRPGGAFSLFRFSVAELAGRVVELEEVLGHEVRALREQLGDGREERDLLLDLEDWLERRLRSAERPDRRVQFVADRLQRGSAAIGRLAHEAGISHKHLVHEFERRVGLTPKLFGRVQRLQRTLVRVAARKKVNWSDVAVAGGFYDQAHLINEFRELIGLTPAEYLVRRSQYPGYLNVA